MSKKYRAERYSRESTIQHKKDERVRKGLADKDRQAWTPQQIDEMLEAFLVDRLSIHGTGTLLTRCKKSLDAVATKLRKIATRIDEYEPGERTDRSKTPFDDRDAYILKLALNKTGKRNGADHDYIAAVLGRTTNFDDSEFR